jgi:hypothetical protein
MEHLPNICDAIIKLILLGMFKCLLSLQGFAEPIYSYDIIRYVEVTDNYIVWYIYIFHRPTQTSVL